MRVLLFGPYPLPGRPPTGGIMPVVQTLARALARCAGVEVAVASAHVGIGPERTCTDGITLYRLPVPRFGRARGHRPLRRALAAIAADFRPDLIHAHGTGYYAAAALATGRPHLITVHGIVRREAALSPWWPLKTKGAWLYDALLEALVLRRARYVVAINPYVRRTFARYTSLRWYDIPNPVEEAFFGLVRRPEPGLLLCPARVIPRKGIDTLIMAFATLADRHPRAQLLIAGETTTMPDYVARCRRLIATSGLASRIHLTGDLDRPALLEALARAWAVVLPARQETAPMAVAEALAAGCPVVATAVGGLPAMVEQGRSGMLVPPEDPAALATALTTVLNGSERVTAMGAAARAAAAMYHPQTVLRQTLAAYGDILGLAVDAF
jgi:glycosyltransferase involved in cell wall biosynthesis